MSSCGLAATLLLACVIAFATAQSTCKDRCGMGYYRGYSCQCDYNCLVYGECCSDYESLCTTKDSCKGRCGETFRRGRLCNCDAECVKYNQCCGDYKAQCDEQDPIPESTEQPIEGPLTLSEGNDPDEGDTIFSTINPTSYPQDDPGDGPDSSPLPEGSSGSPPTDLLEGLPTGPPLPDLDGFEIFPEPATVSTETTTALPQDHTTALPPDQTTALPLDHTTALPPDHTTALPLDQTTVLPLDQTTVLPLDQTTALNQDQTTALPQDQTAALNQDQTTAVPQDQTTAEFTTVGPSTMEPTSASTDANDNSTPPELTTVQDIASTEQTSDITTSSTHLQTESTQPEDVTVMNESTSPSTEAANAPESTEETTTVVLPTANEETTEVQEKDATESPKPTMSTTAAAVSEMSATTVTTNSALQTTTATKQETDQSPTSSDTAAGKPKPEKPFRPVLRPEHKPVLNGFGTDTEYQSDDSNDTNLCSGRPISGVTTLSNGTVVVFRGHFFWVLDQNRVPGPARGITQVWGVPSPIDTVFTRCNCQGKTYIFKGPQYWRYENDVLDRGFPKVIRTGFDGLRGHITAALSVPQHRQRRESVYFFKRGGTVQKYSYQFGTNPSCGRKVHYAVYTNRNRIARQVQAQVSLLGPVINYRTSWHGFPSTITAAVSIPNKREPEGYNYYVFSRAQSYNIRMNGEKPVIAVNNEPNVSHPSNEVFKCPRKTSRS